jgi:hypothetical protein
MTDPQPTSAPNPPKGCAECESPEAAGEPGVAGICYSARNCEGKVLNQRGRKNCKRSGGKSWRGPDGICHNL